MYTTIAIYMYDQFIIISRLVDAIMYLLIFSLCTQLCMCIRISSDVVMLKSNWKVQVYITVMFIFTTSSRLIFTILLYCLRKYQNIIKLPLSQQATSHKQFSCYTCKDYVQYLHKILHTETKMVIFYVTNACEVMYLIFSVVTIIAWTCMYNTMI